MKRGRGNAADDARSGLLAALNARVLLFAEAGDASAVLDESALSEASEILAAAVQEPGDLRAVPAEVIQVLAFLYWSRYQSLPEGEDQDDLSAALEYFGLLADRAPELVPEPVRRFQAVTAWAEYQRTGELGSLDSAVSGLRDSMVADPGRAAAWADLATVLMARFHRTGDSADLDEAVRAGREAVAVTRQGDPDRGAVLNHLAYLLKALFEETGDLAALEEAAQTARRAVATVPAGGRDYPAILGNLVNILGLLSDYTDESGVLEEAVATARAAVAATPSGDPAFGACLSSLSSALYAVSADTGDVAVLEEAVDAARDAVTAIPADSPGRPIALNNLMIGLHALFDRTGDTGALDEAVQAGRAAVAAAPEGHPERVMYLSNLGKALLLESERTGDTDALVEAIEAGRAAVAAVPDGRPERAMYLSNLATALLLESQHRGDAGALDEAVQAGRAAVAAAPEGHPERAMYLSNLASALLVESQRSGDAGALDEAIAAHMAAAATTSIDSSERANLLVALGTSLAKRFEQTRNATDLDAAIAQWQAAVDLSAASPATRLSAAEQWAEEAFDAGNINAALDGYTVAMGLLTEMAWGWPARMSWGKELRRRADLASDAAACAVAAGRPALAIELLEQARSLFWNQALGLQPELEALSRHAPDLARRLSRIRAALSGPTRYPSSLAQATETGRRIGYGIQNEPSLMAQEWSALLDQIRTIDGFEDFLMPVSYEQLAPAAKDGPVVVLNASRHGCHALVMNTSSIKVISLPRLTLKDALAQAGRLIGVLVGTPRDPSEESRIRANAILLDLLQWEWDTIASPVLDALNLRERPQSGTPLPHIWWCPTGPLTVLPIHAAGRYPRDGSTAFLTDSMLDRAVSSYTSTLSALLRTKGYKPPGTPRQLIVALPDTPGYPPIPGIPSELAAVERHLPARDTDELIGSEATRIGVLKALSTHSWVHMACHAAQHPADPSRSGFVLWDGMLTVTDIANLRSARPELAFLSSCQTATADVRLTDETMQFAGLMQFLGYRDVITTMWEVPDLPAAQVAESVYSFLAESNPVPNGEISAAIPVAEAVHNAVQQLRGSYPAEPLLWASYIHFGR